LANFRKDNPKNLIMGHLNINGLGNKIFEVHDMLIENFFDLLFLAETKLDASFPNAQFHAQGFKMHRSDRNGNGGGIVAYIRNDLPHRRRSDLEKTLFIQ